MQIEIARVRDQIESQIEQVQPIFGEETGEFVDFTKYTQKNARLESLSIVNVKQPLFGSTYPSEVQGNLRFSLKDLNQEQR